MNSKQAMPYVFGLIAAAFTAKDASAQYFAAGNTVPMPLKTSSTDTLIAPQGDTTIFSHTARYISEHNGGLFRNITPAGESLKMELRKKDGSKPELTAVELPQDPSDKQAEKFEQVKNGMFSRYDALVAAGAKTPKQLRDGPEQ